MVALRLVAAFRRVIKIANDGRARTSQIKLR
jgi:hypothetical protein